MTIQHRLIPDGELHEPKGVVSAAQNTAYFSNGAASGTWKKVGSETLKGLSGDGGTSGLKFLSDGANGFTTKLDTAYGVMAITANGNAFAVGAAADPTLISTADYVLFTGTGAPWAGEMLYGVSFNTNQLTVPVNGVYDFKAWGSVSSFPTNGVTVGVRFRVNGATWSPRTVLMKATASSDRGNFSAFGLIELNAGDYIQLYVASTAAGNIVFQNVNCTVNLVRAT